MVWIMTIDLLLRLSLRECVLLTYDAFATVATASLALICLSVLQANFSHSLLNPTTFLLPLCMFDLSLS